jgi:hypothetical protein
VWVAWENWENVDRREVVDLMVFAVEGDIHVCVMTFDHMGNSVYHQYMTMSWTRIRKRYWTDWMKQSR